MSSSFKTVGRNDVFLFPPLRAVVPPAAFALRHGQRLRQFRNLNMQGLCTGLAGLVLHEWRVAW